MVAGDEGDDRDIEAAESENFAVGDEVLGMFVVGAGADEAADLVKDGGDLEEEGVVLVELVEFLGFLEESFGEEGDVVEVFGVGLVLSGEDFRGADHLGLEAGGEGGGDGEVEEEAAFVVAVGDADVGEFEGVGDGEVDFEGGEDGLGGVEVELVGADAFLAGEAGGLAGEGAEVFEGAAESAAGEEGIEELDFVADDDDVLDGFVLVVEAHLSDLTADVFVDDAEEGGAVGVGGFHGLAAAVGAEAVAGVAFDAALLEEEGAGVAGADVHDEGGALLHGRRVEEAAAGLEVDEAGHLAVVEDLDAESAGDAEAVLEDIAVAGFGEDVGGHDAFEFQGADAELAEGFEEAEEDLDGAFGGGAGDLSDPEDVPGEGEGLFHELDGFGRGVGRVLGADDEHGDAAGTDVDGCLQTGGDEGRGGIHDWRLAATGKGCRWVICSVESGGDKHQLL